MRAVAALLASLCLAASGDGGVRPQKKAPDRPPPRAAGEHKSPGEPPRPNPASPRPPPTAEELEIVRKRELLELLDLLRLLHLLKVLPAVEMDDLLR
jgi:hypothetical protein